MHIAVIGTGYVGLTSTACFAKLGHHVVGVDIDEKKVEMLRRGESPIYEPGLTELLQEGLKSGRLRFTTELQEGLKDAKVVFSAVATPPGEGHKADLRAVFAVAESVGQHAQHDIVFVNKSTVPVGTGKQCADRLEETLNKRNAGIQVAVVSNPEFLREGMAVSDTLMPERIVVGVNGEQWARDLMEELYRPLTRIGRPLLFMARESAEMVKYACNSFLATKISFINMIGELAEKTGADITDIARGMGLDTRIGGRFLHAGIGYGGSCFPKDVRALLATAEEYDVAFPIIESADTVNMHQRERFVQQILSSFTTPATLGVWGLSFKPKTDDMRDAPSIDIIHALVEAGHTIKAFDPVAIERAKPLLPNSVQYTQDEMEAAKEADGLLLLTEWDEFRGIDLEELKNTMRGTHLFDGRNVYEPHEAAEAGLTYHGIGRR